MTRTKIEWATHVWNPVTGCTKVSEGCRNCYAERMVKRLGSRVHAREVHQNADGTWRDGDDLPFGRVAWHKVWRIGKKAAGRELDGRTWDEIPEAQS